MRLASLIHRFGSRGFVAVGAAGIRVVEGGGQPGRALVPRGIVRWRGGMICSVNAGGNVKIMDDGSRTNDKAMFDGYQGCKTAGECAKVAMGRGKGRAVTAWRVLEEVERRGVGWGGSLGDR